MEVETDVKLECVKKVTLYTPGKTVLLYTDCDECLSDVWVELTYEDLLKLKKLMEETYE